MATGDGPTPAEIMLVEDLAASIRARLGAGQEEIAEQLIEMLLERTGVDKFLNYWKLGDLIYDENPYFSEDEIQFDLARPNAIRRAGILAAYKASATFGQANPGAIIPKPPELGGPASPRAWYHRVGRNSGEIRPGGPLGGGKPEENVEQERNIVKEVEIEYGPLIDEEDKQKAPHIIVFYCGGDH